VACPYRGLFPFREENAEFFFGRDRFLAGEDESKPGLIKVVHTQPLVPVIGASGSGKSSVIFAGLVPKLRLEGTWLIDTFRPQRQPFEQLASALVRLLKPNLDEFEQLRRESSLVIDMMDGGVTLSQIVSKILETNFGKRVLLIIDQFEEIYTPCPSNDQEKFINTREKFIKLLVDATNTENLTIVLTLRADFYGNVISYPVRYPQFSDMLQRFTPQLLGSMNQEELRSSIEKPLEKSGISLEAELTQRILDDLGQEPGNLPLLEFALFELWKRQDNGKLTHLAYGEIGGVKKAIANHAERTYNQLDPIKKKQAEYIFTQLVYPGRGTDGIRRVATRSEIGDKNWDLVNELANYKEHPTDYSARLLVTGWDKRKEEDTVEIVHEALIREWKDLQKWVDREYKFRTWQESLRFSIQTWEESKRDKSALIRGKLLVESEKWQRLKSININSLERNFIQKSRQRERLSQYKITALGIFSAGLLILAHRQFTENQFENKFYTIFIGGSDNPNDIPILQEALQKAHRQVENNNIDAAIERCKAILIATRSFKEKASQEKGYESRNDLKEIERIRESSEKFLASIIRDKYMSVLKEELGKGHFGTVREGAKLNQFENKFSGALKTTYAIIMSKPGLNVDKDPKDGRLSVNEALNIPCETLKQIEELWHKATGYRCRFYGENIMSASGCKELSTETLSLFLFNAEEGIENRVTSCKLN
jgi:hypothetical protein